MLDVSWLTRAERAEIAQALRDRRDMIGRRRARSTDGLGHAGDAASIFVVLSLLAELEPQ